MTLLDDKTSEAYLTGKAKTVPKYDHAISLIVEQAMKQAKCLVTPENTNWTKASSKWNSYAAAGELQAAVGRVLLPDISSLPVSLIMELRDQVKGSLEPMRAELLRFTKALRKMVEANPNDPKAINVEAENLIVTNVEPVVREAKHRTQELAEKKWHKLKAEGLRAFGLAGASYLHPALLGTAINQAMKAVGVAAEKSEDEHLNPKMTAQFVLEAHSFLRERK